MATQRDPETREPAGAALEGGSYEVIRKRLLDQAKVLAERAEALNRRRTEAFGGLPLAVVGNERVRTEHNCVPRDIVSLGGRLLFGYNVFLGLKTETHVSDVFSLHQFVPAGEAFDLSQVPSEAAPGLFDHPQFQKEFVELYRYYKDARLLAARKVDGKLLAVFQVGQTLQDIKAFRWALSPKGEPTYIDNRGDEDHRFPPAFDFEWVRTTREQHVQGRHPHVNILDEVFVETVGGDLTVKIEDNTQDGMGIYREPVDDLRQSLDDAEIRYAKVGGLILIEVLPYREQVRRYLVFNTRTKAVVRIDAIGQCCVQLPEDHGVIFPGGYYLQTGEMKVFDADIEDLVLERAVRSPNGEDVLYVFYHQVDGRYLLLPYNLIRKEVQTPITCHGYTLFEDGKMLVSRSTASEPTRVHPIQIWQTPFTSDEWAAALPTDGSFLSKVGNADLVRGISEAFALRRLIETERPTRQTFEDLIASATRVLDSYYWLGHAEVGDLRAPLAEIKHNADLVVGEFEKVLTLQKRAEEALAEAAKQQKELLRGVRPEDWRAVADFLSALTAMRKQRGHLITLKDIRYIDLPALEKLEAEVIQAFERVSKGCVEFLLTGAALGPLIAQIEALSGRIEEVEKAGELDPLRTELETLSEGLTVLSEVLASLEIQDPAHRTQVLESISEVFSHLNRVRAVLLARRKELLSKEGKAEFGAQFKLLGQSVASALALADAPERCDEQLSRLMVQLEELEGRFSEFDEFLGELAAKREEIYEAFETKKQQLLDERQRRAQNLAGAADRILQGVTRRARGFTTDDELNGYFASDPMILKLRQLLQELQSLGDSVKADDLESRLKSARQDALRNLRDKQDLYEGGDAVIKLGRHRFNVHTQAFELTLVPRDGGMALHLSGTEFYERITDPAFEATRTYWEQQLVSETPEVYRGEYLAASILFAAERGEAGLDLGKLTASARDEQALLGLVRAYAAERYDEGYERGIHDHDAALILEKLLSARATAGLLRYGADCRALACLFWAFHQGERERGLWQRRAQSLGRLVAAFPGSASQRVFGDELGGAIRRFLETHGIAADAAALERSGLYLAEELAAAHPRFTTSQDAYRLLAAFLDHLDLKSSRSQLEDELRALEGSLPERLALARAWIDAYLADAAPEPIAALESFALEAAVLFLTEHHLEREESAALTRFRVEGLLGQHPRIEGRAMELALDELLTRLELFRSERVPGFLEFKRVRHELLERERNRLRLEELKPKVLTSFVRNRLISEVYLPIIGDNLAKQLGAAGEKKRTDLMGMLLLISPPGYGKTTLMEYVASRMGMVFMKINGPALGHSVVSIDPSEAPNATARQEVEKINLALEMGNNVMLYLDDIQHTNPELLQKFISLCDAQRRIEGVWKGRTRTYDLRGKKFAVVMAGNPYTESGDKFQIPDMLANRADVYNLGDILGGREELFALSYLENSLTSNATLAPVAARSLEDIHLFIKVAQGGEVAQTDFKHSYSQVEVEELTSVIKKLFVAQRVLLQVNLEYIASASQDDRFRTEPPFKLQGSYRNMNKLAEKIVPAMNDAELGALLKDHYLGESQTLTTGAEHNLLKLGEMLNSHTPEEAARWAQIKRDFRRIQVAGGPTDDPVTRVTSTLGSLGEHLDGIRGQLAEAVAKRAEPEAKDGKDQALAEALARLSQAVAAERSLSVAVQSESPKQLEQLLTRHLAALEATLLPLARASADSLDELKGLGRPLLELVEVLKLDALTGRTNERPRSLGAPSPELPPRMPPAAPE